MTPRERAEAMIELLDHENGYMSMKFKDQSGLLWHSSDIKLMRMRKEEMVQSIAKVIQEAMDDFWNTPMSGNKSGVLGPPYTLYFTEVKQVEQKHDVVEFSVKPKVDDTQEFNLVRCPKCELMVEELVATPYRHVCANCAKGD